jgi:hypothetical protein
MVTSVMASKDREIAELNQKVADLTSHITQITDTMKATKAILGVTDE